MAVAVYLSTINGSLSNICDDRKASGCLSIGNCITYWHATPTRRKHLLKLPYQAKTGPILNWLKHKKELLLHKNFSVIHPPISTPSAHIYSPSSTLLHVCSLSILNGTHIFSLGVTNDWFWCSSSLTFNLYQEVFPHWYSSQGMKLTTHLHLIPRLRMLLYLNFPTCLLGVHKDNNTLLFITSIKQVQRILTRQCNYIFQFNLHIINLYANTKWYTFLQLGRKCA